MPQIFQKCNRILSVFVEHRVKKRAPRGPLAESRLRHRSKRKPVLPSEDAVRADVLIPVIIGLVLFVLLFGFLPKALGNRIVRGAIIGSLIAGDVGAIIGAAVAAGKEKNE